MSVPKRTGVSRRCWRSIRAMPTITAPITLVQDQRRLPGVLLYVPVYAHRASQATPEQRRAALIGLLYAPIVVEGFVARHRRDPSRPDSISAVRFDRRFVRQGSASSARRGDTAAGPDSLFSKQDRGAAVRVGTCRCSSTARAQFDAEVSSLLPWAVFVAGVLASALLALLLQQQSTGLIRAETLARQMTADLDRLALVARRTSNAVAITDAQRRITWVNEGFERITGYPEAQAIGQPLALLSHDGSDLATLRRLDAGAAGRRAVHRHAGAPPQRWPTVLGRNRNPAAARRPGASCPASW